MRVHRFAAISGIGWLCDFCILLTLVHFGVHPMLANILSAGTAVSLVFVLSQKSLFVASNHFLVRKFALYVMWNVAAITVASALIAQLSVLVASSMARLHLGIGSDLDADLAVLVAKIAITPLTMYANYLALTAIMEGRASWR